MIVHLIEDEVLRQVFGEGEARRRSIAWDPQVKKALELVPKAELLLRDPRTFVAEREHDRTARRRRRGRERAAPVASKGRAAGGDRGKSAAAC